MKKGFVIVILFSLFGPYSLLAKKDIKYSVHELTDDLKKNAKAVVRLEKHEFELKSDARAIEKVKYAITILNENGYALSSIEEYYNNFIKIRDISATVYSATGEKIHRIKTEDIYDVSATSSISIYDDNRMKTFEPNTKDYPFTIEYSFEREYNGIFSFPTWSLFKDYNVSVEKAIFKIKGSNLDKIRIKQVNLNDKPVVTEEKGIQTKTWELKNFYAKKREPFSKSVYEYMPIIRLAPMNIDIKGNKGSYESWQSYGNFINNLSEGLDMIPEKTQQEVLELTKDASTDFEKIKLVYEYMQNKTRYVSIQVGMGGWQPFEAEVVDRLGYGDCKALSNYMKSLLKVVGINSIYTLVYAGNNKIAIDNDFPLNQFNHAILCVPLSSDTLWLECTSQQLPCGYISDFTDDREVLLIKKDHSQIARTKSYKMEENHQERSISVDLYDSGDAIAKTVTNYKGLQYDNVSRVFQLDETDKRKFLQKKIDIPNFYLTSYEHDNKKSKLPVINETLELELRGYASLMGTKIILPLNLMNKQTYVPPHLRNRKSEIVINKAFIDTDSITYNLPKGYYLESAPEPIAINTPYGKYYAKVETEENRIVYTRTFCMKQGCFPPGEYYDFREFFEKVCDADEMKCILSKR